MAGGQSITSGQGTFGQAETVPLVGSSIASGTGYVGTIELLTAAATAAAGSTAGGAIVPLRSRKVGGGAASRALSGQPLAFTAGSVVFVQGPPLVGQLGAMAQGAMTKTRTAALSGSAVTAAQATISTTQGNLNWEFAQGATLNTGANQQTDLATNVPSGVTFCASPGLLPGQTLVKSGTTLRLVGDSTVPTVNDSVPDSPKDVISRRDIVIDVMDSPIATIYNRTQGTTFGLVHNGTTWWSCISAAAQGDVIEISPGAINATEADCIGYFHNTIDACGMAFVQGVTVRNIPGRGRWRLFPAGYTTSIARSGINIFGPAEVGDFGPVIRKTIVIEGFDITDQWGTNRDAYGFRMRGSSAVSWDGVHASVTARNFKLGKTSGLTGSGFQDTAETLVIEDGHLFDCGQSGFEHNAYISARTMTIRGVRASRTRGYISTPPDVGTWDPYSTIDGHILKVDAVNGSIEGCAIDCAELSDPSHLVQMKGGGNWTLRGNLFIDPKYPRTNRGAVNMCREMAGPSTPNFKWWAGSEGNSLTYERNVHVSKYPRPIVCFLDQSSTSAMRPASGGSWTAAERLNSLVVRDNIGMVTSTPANHMAAGFPGVGNSMWIDLDPNGGPTWAARGNTTETFDSSYSAFADQALMLFTRAAGTVAASGSLSTKRFTWPHGYMDRTDAYRGLA